MVFCTIMSTSMLASLIGFRICAATVGLSGTPQNGQAGLVAIERNAGYQGLPSSHLHM